jgi:hypothetical protein
VQRTASKWGKTGAKNHACICKVCVSNNAFRHQTFGPLNQWLEQALGKSRWQGARKWLPAGATLCPGVEALAGLFAQIARIDP